jgi:hypothetical protein
VPAKLLRREHVNGTDLFDAPAENLIAEGRIILAALLLITAWISPGFLTPHGLLATQVLIAYAVVAVGIIAIRAWRLPGRGVSYAVHAIDIVVLCTLGVLTEARSTPFFAFFGFSVLLAASLRWNWQGVMGTAFVLAIAMWVNTLQHAGPAGEAAARSVAFARSLYILMAGAMLAFSGALRERRRQQLTRLTEWPGPNVAQIDSPHGILADTPISHVERMLARIRGH